MDEQENQNNQARAIFEMVHNFISGERDRNTRLQLCKKCLEPSATGAMQKDHLISYVVFRCIRQGNRDQIWELENIGNNVGISQLDHILLRDQNSQGYAVHYDRDEEGDVKTAMSKNPNVVFLRTVFDWSRVDENIWSRQIAWSGSFEESQRLVRLFAIGNGNSNTHSPSSAIKFKIHHFDLHWESRNMFIFLRDGNPLAATFSLIISSPTVDISQENVGSCYSGELLCVICQDKLPIGEKAKQLPCKHLFHEGCITQWFYRQLQCPVCRREFGKK